MKSYQTCTSATISSLVTGERTSIGSSFVERERNFSILINLRTTYKQWTRHSHIKIKSNRFIILNNISSIPERQLLINLTFWLLSKSSGTQLNIWKVTKKYYDIRNIHALEHKLHTYFIPIHTGHRRWKDIHKTLTKCWWMIWSIVKSV